MKKESQSTTVHLPIAINKAIPEAEQTNELKEIVMGCTLNHYHDFKSQVHDAPKSRLLQDLNGINDKRLAGVIMDIMDGVYDEEPDLEDMEALEEAFGKPIIQILRESGGKQQ